MSREYLPFIDWMKCAGITLIVVGHVAAAPINDLTPPIYPKQLGVAFFMFIIGFSLARETRPVGRVLYNRLFEVYLYGLAIAALLSAVTFLSRGTLALSNYLPFLGGANVLFNNFPANPTTWYIGTYLHVLIIGAVVLRRVQVRLWMIAAVAVAEIAVRGMLVAYAGAYVGYMLVTNWATVLVAGAYFGQRAAGSTADTFTSRVWPWAAMAGLGVVWVLIVENWVAARSFPFMHLSLDGRPAPIDQGPVVDFLSSTLVTLLYSCWAILVFRATRRLPTPSLVRFLARNTLIVFIAHMPVFYVVEAALKARGWSYGERSFVLVAVCLFGLAAVSEVIRSVANPEPLRRRLLERLATRQA